MENTTPKANTTKPMSENAQKVLATLKAEVSPMTTAELAAAAGVSAAAVTGSVQGLNKRGLIVKGVKSIEVDGKDIRNIPHYIRRYVGFIFQQFHLVENM